MPTIVFEIPKRNLTNLESQIYTATTTTDAVLEAEVCEIKAAPQPGTP
jgi:hypothetical protein